MAVSKSPEAFRTISEVAAEVDVPQHVLRFWEGKFTQIKPLKRGGGRRYYRPEDVDLIRGIRNLLYVNGYTIKGVQKVLREQGVRHVIATGRGGAPAPEVPGAGNGAAGAAAQERVPAMAMAEEAVSESVAAPAPEEGAAPRPGAEMAREPVRREALLAALAELRRLRAMIEEALRADAAAVRAEARATEKGQAKG